MRRSLSLLAGALVALVGPLSARAAKVVTTPALGVAASHFFGCLLTNLDKKPIDVDVEVVDFNGTVVGHFVNHELPPGGTVAGSFPGGIALSPAYYCRVSDFSPRKVRLTACVSLDGLECTAVATAP